AGNKITNFKLLEPLIFKALWGMNQPCFLRGVRGDQRVPKITPNYFSNNLLVLAMYADKAIALFVEIYESDAYGGH
ncbi:MAG: hypothetical protein ACYTXC_09725, partial [Nostoc sp.]